MPENPLISKIKIGDTIYDIKGRELKMNNNNRIRDIKITTNEDIMHEYYILSVVEQQIIDTIMLTDTQYEKLSKVNMKYGTLRFIRKDDNDE